MPVTLKTVEQSDTFDQWRVKTNQISADVVQVQTDAGSGVGNLATLTTGVKTSAVAAINELDSDIGTVPNLTTTADSNVVVAINELDAEISDITTLTTTAKSTLVLAINELDSDIGNLTTLTTSAKSTAVAAINELDVDIGNKASLTTTVKTSLVAAVNELDGEIGVLANLGTTEKSSLVGAINELNIGSLAALTTTVKSSVVGAINELDGEIGDLSTLATTAKSTLVGAINEVEGLADDVGDLSTLTTSVKTTTVAAINEVRDDVQALTAITITNYGQLYFDTHMAMASLSATSFRLFGGGIVIQGTGLSWSQTDITGLSFSAAGIHYIYLYNNTGTIAVEISTTVPVRDATNREWSKTGDSSRRCIGWLSVWNDSTYKLTPFNASFNKGEMEIRYHADGANLSNLDFAITTTGGAAPVITPLEITTFTSQTNAGQVLAPKEIISKWLVRPVINSSASAVTQEFALCLHPTTWPTSTNHSIWSDYVWRLPISYAGTATSGSTTYETYSPGHQWIDYITGSNPWWGAIRLAGSNTSGYLACRGAAFIP